MTTEYSNFVKLNYNSVRHLKNADRFKALAEMWNTQKGGKKKGTASKSRKSLKGGG